jgi:hypothetical protein
VSNKNSTYCPIPKTEISDNNAENVLMIKDKKLAERYRIGREHDRHSEGHTGRGR